MLQPQAIHQSKKSIMTENTMPSELCLLMLLHMSWCAQTSASGNDIWQQHICPSSPYPQCTTKPMKYLPCFHTEEKIFEISSKYAVLCQLQTTYTQKSGPISVNKCCKSSPCLSRDHYYICAIKQENRDKATPPLTGRSASEGQATPRWHSHHRPPSHPPAGEPTSGQWATWQPWQPSWCPCCGQTQMVSHPAACGLRGEEGGTG